jgi:hypothetical protein
MYLARMIVPQSSSSVAAVCDRRLRAFVFKQSGQNQTEIKPFGNIANSATGRSPMPAAACRAKLRQPTLATPPGGVLPGYSSISTHIAAVLIKKCLEKHAKMDLKMSIVAPSDFVPGLLRKHPRVMLFTQLSQTMGRNCA